MTTWRIQTDQLVGARAQGESALDQGVQYQQAYAAWQLVKLLLGRDGLVGVRYGGAEDVDLLYADGSERDVQLKSTTGRFFLSSLKPILRDFAVHLLRVGAPAEKLRFELVSASGDLQPEVRRIADHSATEDDRKEVVQALGGADSPDGIPTELVALTIEERSDFAARLLACVDLSFNQGDLAEGIYSFELRARDLLTDAGIADVHLQKEAIRRIKDALRARTDYTRESVESLLRPLLVRSAAAVFDHKVELLDGDDRMPRATEERVKNYYEGHPVGWDIIAADADVARTQQEVIFQTLVEQPDGARVVCLVDHPANGKSTLMLRLGWLLNRRAAVPVLRLRGQQDDSVWRELDAFHSRIRRPFVVLIDDLFRRKESLLEADDVDPTIPVTILTTAWPGECKLEQLKLPIIAIELVPISGAERARVIERLKVHPDALSPSERNELENANSFLALMMVLTTGKGLKGHFDDVLKWLKSEDDAVYRAYEYVCFTFCFDVTLPTDLLERVDGKGRFHNLLGHPAARAVLFEADTPELLKPAHIRIAEVVLELYGRDPAHLLRELATAVDTTDDGQRRLFAHLLRGWIARGRTVPVELRRVIHDCQSNGTPSELSIWAQHLRGEPDPDAELNRLAEMALARGPVTAADCRSLHALVRTHEQGVRVVELLEGWLGAHPDEIAIDRLALRLASSYTPTKIPALLGSLWAKASNDLGPQNVKYCSEAS